MMVPASLLAVDMINLLPDQVRASPWYGASVRSQELLYGKKISSLRAEVVTMQYFSVDKFMSWYNEGLPGEERASALKAGTGTSRPRPRLHEKVKYFRGDGECSSSGVLGRMKQ